MCVNSYVLNYDQFYKTFILFLQPPKSHFYSTSVSKNLCFVTGVPQILAVQRTLVYGMHGGPVVSIIILP